MNTNMKINDYPLITKHKFIYQERDYFVEYNS